MLFRFVVDRAVGKRRSNGEQICFLMAEVLSTQRWVAGAES